MGRVWTELEKMPLSDLIHGELHAEQEYEAHFFLSLVLSSLPGVYDTRICYGYYRKGKNQLFCLWADFNVR